jgi:hypothetical protein
MPSLEVVSPVEDEVVSSYSFDTEPGATVSVSGFHGTQTYTLSAHDQTLVIRFTGVTDFQEAAPVGLSGTKQRAAVPEDAPEGEEGAEETDAEQMQRELAEAAAAANDKKAGQDKVVTLIDDQGTRRTYTFVEEETPAPAPAATKSTATATKSTSTSSTSSSS